MSSHSTNLPYDVIRPKLSIEVNSLRVQDLKNILQSVSLPRSGVKADLVGRIMNFIDSLHQNNQVQGMKQAVNRVRQEVIHAKGFSDIPEYDVGANGGGGGAAAVSSGAAFVPQRAVMGLARAGGGGPSSNNGLMVTLQNRGGGVEAEAHSNPGYGGGGISTLAGLSRPVAPKKDPTISTAPQVRCICGQTTTPWGQTICTGCRQSFHPHCYGSMTNHRRAYPALCFLCLSLTQDPFMKVEETILPPTKLGGTRHDFSTTYKLSHTQQREIMETRGIGQKIREGFLRLALRCYPLNLHEMNKGKVDLSNKPPFYPPHCWPLDTLLRVNNETVHIKQRQVYFHGVHKKWKGSSEPADIFMNSRTGMNRLTMTFRDDNPYVVVVQLVRVVSVEQLSRRVLGSLQTPSIAEALERVKKSFQVCSVDSDDEGGEPMATVTRLSLRCPLGLCPIVTPARGKDCQHLQCFDLETFLRFNEKCNSAGWKCGVCHGALTLEDLRVDSFMLDILRKLKETKATENNDDMDSIEIDNLGQWKLFSSSALSNRKRKGGPSDEGGGKSHADDGSIDVEDLNVKPSANGNGNGASSSGAAAASVDIGGWGAIHPVNGGGCGAAATAPAAAEAIDLTFSDSEDDTPLARYGSSSSSSSRPTTQVVEVLVDDDGEDDARGGGGGRMMYAAPPTPPLSSVIRRGPEIGGAAAAAGSSRRGGETISRMPSFSFAAAAAYGGGGGSSSDGASSSSSTATAGSAVAAPAIPTFTFAADTFGDSQGGGGGGGAAVGGPYQQATGEGEGGVGGLNRVVSQQQIDDDMDEFFREHGDFIL